MSISCVFFCDHRSKTLFTSIEMYCLCMKKVLLLALCLLSMHSVGAAQEEKRFLQVSPQAMPRDTNARRASELVEVIRLDSTIKLDIYYAFSDKNVFGKKFYAEARAFLQRPAAEAFVRAHRAVKKHGYGLLITDAYRPWRVTKMFWDITPPDKREFVANPNDGSRHNRGCAVDVTLYDLSTGKEVSMPSKVDEMSERAYPTYMGGTEKSRALRDLLKSVMEAEGFKVIRNEWWHFDYKDWREYPIMDIEFREIH